MIQNLPERIDASIIERFDFGESEAVNDSLLESCFCDIDPIRTFLKDQRSILVGAKGSGKTAVFTLLKTGHLKFYRTDKERAILIGIDEPIEYSTAASIIESALKSNIKDETILYQFLWEIYILYRVCLAIRKEHNIQCIKQKIDNLCQVFDGEQAQPTLIQFLKSAKRTIGVKFDTNNPAFPAPNFYMSSEPTSGASQRTDNSPLTTIDLQDYKKEIDSALKKEGIRVYILVDNLDDFVAKDEYKTQRTILHSILNCCRSYRKYSRLRLKVSLRSDLFHKLDFSQLGGYDKIVSNMIELTWTDRNIREFISRRLAINLMRTLRLRGLKMAIDEQSLYLPPPESNQSLVKQISGIVSWFWNKIKPDKSIARKITAYDQISRHIILTLFPRDVFHMNANGKKEKSELFTYLESHFDLGNGHTTPRIVLLFLQKMVQVVSDYYRENPDKKILKRTEKNEFPLFMRDHFIKPYVLLQKDMIEIIKSCMTIDEWQKKTSILFSKKGKKTTFSFQALCNLVSLVNAEDAQAYAAYLTHLGVLKCKDSDVQYQNRTYELPLLFQFIWGDRSQP